MIVDKINTYYFNGGVDIKKIKDIVDCDYDLEISGIAEDSRKIKKGYLFVATKGFYVDHFDYIEDAIKNGCSCVVCDRDISFDIPYVKVADVNSFYVNCCQKFYDVDLNDYRFIGITGTDGKTTTATIVRELIGNAAYIGTNGFSVVDKNFSTENTTPCTSELFQNLNYIKKSKCANTVMEISSEALLHGRVKNFQFDIIGFTNITGDHLNVHGSFENYVECKKKLLNLVKNNGYVVINGDDSILMNINCHNMCTFGFNSKNDYVISNVKYLSNFTKFVVKNGSNEYFIKSKLQGKHNVYNVTMAFVIGLLFGNDSSELIERIWDISTVDGRCEYLDFGQKYKIVLDYAHTVNGTKNILEAFMKFSRLITIVGCAGGREVDKRNIIGNMVMDASDVAIFTMDDPRYENVSDIIDQMAGDREDFIKIINREQAINYALSIANDGDVVLILGKGRDNYMAVENKKIFYSDYDVVKKYFDDR